MVRRHPPQRAVALLPTCFVLAALAICPGCVRRRMLIRSNPPGAMVYVDNQPVGTTPCPVDFVYYGTREIRLVKPGFETKTVNQPIPAPWYEWPPLDFVSENIVPKEIQDYRTLSYDLAPQMVVPTDQLLARAEQLRVGAQQGVTPTAALGSLPADPSAFGAPVQQPLFVPPGTVPTPAPEPVSPGIVVPPSPGGAVLPPGGRTLDPLPQP